MEDVRIARPNGQPLRAALALPRGDSPHPAVIVIHEIFGLNQDIRDKAQRLAGMGYVALAPDLYDGRGPQPICVMRAVNSLRKREGPAFEDLDAARAWLSDRDDVDASRIGVIGFCLGGGFALMFAARAPLGAAAIFYGDVPKDPSLLDSVCPVVASYGGRDRIFAPHGKRLATFLDATTVPHDVVSYPEAGHSFMSDHHGVMAKFFSWGPMRVGFNPAAAEDSWRRVESFFDEHLRSGPVSPDGSRAESEP